MASLGAVIFGAAGRYFIYFPRQSTSQQGLERKRGRFQRFKLEEQAHFDMSFVVNRALPAEIRRLPLGDIFVQSRRQFFLAKTDF